jgi:hypothetical protein
LNQLKRGLLTINNAQELAEARGTGQETPQAENEALQREALQGEVYGSQVEVLQAENEALKGRLFWFDGYSDP